MAVSVYSVLQIGITRDETWRCVSLGPDVNHENHEQRHDNFTDSNLLKLAAYTIILPGIVSSVEFVLPPRHNISQIYQAEFIRTVLESIVLCLQVAWV
ncbi:unnamed protein product [Fusarium graminearum]|nr:unnamed protein product [Fusarium graminearum]